MKHHAIITNRLWSALAAPARRLDQAVQHGARLMMSAANAAAALADRLLKEDAGHDERQAQTRKDATSGNPQTKSQTPPSPEPISGNPLSEALARCRSGFGAVVLFSFVINVLMLTGPLYMLQIYDRVLTSGSTETLAYLTLVAAFAFLIIWGLEIVRGRVMLQLGGWLDRRLGGEVLAASLKATLGRKDVSITPVDDITAIRTFLTGPAVFPILDAPWTPIFLAAIFLLHPLLGWIALTGACVLFGFALANERSTREPLLRAGASSSLALDEARAAARNVDVIEAMGMMPGVAARWAQRTGRSLGDQARASRLSGLIGASSKMIRQLLQIGLLGVGAYLVLDNQLSGGGMIAGSILMARALAPVEQAIMSWRSVIKARGAYHRIDSLLGSSTRTGIAHPLPAPKGNFSIEGLSFAHPGEREPMLRNISFELKAGESLGLIGPTAAGKTTLARILIGNLKPQMGHARLDGADVATWDASDRGQYIGYLPQDIELFSGTVRDNIARLGEVDGPGVYAAAQAAGVHEDILSLPQGYDTEIGAGGMALSGGQRQRIGLARALYGNPKVVVLDEPNASLDTLGERALFEALEHLRKEGTTIIVIAHRPNVLGGVDKILMLRDGEIELFGPRAEVLAKLAPPAAAPARSTGAAKQGAMTAQIQFGPSGVAKAPRKGKRNKKTSALTKRAARAAASKKAEGQATEGAPRS
jgi:PrtD family type I secretion system ABC transporter